MSVRPKRKSGLVHIRINKGWGRGREGGCYYFYYFCYYIVSRGGGVCLLRRVSKRKSVRVAVAPVSFFLGFPLLWGRR